MIKNKQLLALLSTLLVLSIVWFLPLGNSLPEPIRSTQIVLWSKKGCPECARVLPAFN